MRLLTKAEACRELGVSLSTLDRRITAGQLMVRREAHGQRHRVYIVMEDNALQLNGAIYGTLEAGSRDSQIAVARERIRGLEEQVAILRNQLIWEKERNLELFDELKEVRQVPAGEKLRGPWWKFWERPAIDRDSTCSRTTNYAQ